MNITLIVPGVPVAQPRQRHRIVATGGKVFTQNYTPKGDPVNVFKAAIQHAWQQANAAMFEGPVEVRIVALFPRPKSATRKRGDNPRLKKITKPDGDNVFKSVADALNKLAYNDDSQIWKHTIERWIGEPHEQPETRIEITAS